MLPTLRTSATAAVAREAADTAYQSAGHRALETHGGTGDTLGLERPLRGHRLFGGGVRTNDHLM